MSLIISGSILILFIGYRLWNTKQQNIDSNPIQETTSKLPTLHEERELQSGKGTFIFKQGVTSNIRFGGEYHSKGDQQALFQDQIMYFDFREFLFAKQMEMSLFMITGSLAVELANLDTPTLNKTLYFETNAENKNQLFDFVKSGVLGNSGDIHTLKIWATSPISIFDYDIRIREPR